MLSRGDRTYFALGGIIEKLASEGQHSKAQVIVDFLFSETAQADSLNTFMKSLAGLINTHEFDFFQLLYDHIVSEQDSDRRARYYATLKNKEVPKKWKDQFIALAKRDSSKVIQYNGNNWDTTLSQGAEVSQVVPF